MNRRVLLVDDDPHALSAYRRQMCRSFDLTTALSGHEGLKVIRRSDDFAVIVSDMTMPEMNGVEFLQNARELTPRSIRIMLTGNADQRTAMDAINSGNIFRFLTKPCHPEMLTIVLNEGLAEFSQVLANRDSLIREQQNRARIESALREQMEATQHAHEATVNHLVTASMYRDEETGAHIKRTGLYCELFARSLGWSESDVDTIRLAAPMHDVGKIGIPDSILQKAGRLTGSEFEIMKTHTVIGANMLSDQRSPLLKMAHIIAMYHHERWDGTGYPYGLAGEEIPECARIMTIVDVYDALSHARVYRPAFKEAEVLQVLQGGSGTHFEPRLLKAFFLLLPEMARIAQENADTEVSETATYSNFQCEAKPEPHMAAMASMQM